MRSFWLAWQFLSQLPAPRQAEPTAQQIAASLLWYAPIGLLLGGLLFAAAWLLGDQPSLLAAALVLLGWIALTGILHLDGLADCADAWVGGHGDKARSLAIMKDPACGPAGVVALVLLLLLKFAALVALLEQGLLWPLLCIPMLSRALLPLLFLSTPYVRAGGLGATMAEQLPRRASWLVLAGILLLVLVTPLLWPSWMPLLWLLALVAVLVFALVRRASMRRLDGFTGDVAGALVVITEVVLLLVCAFVV
ncbi:MAG: adenosylcobinamide-GDP ribazoletransferase [Chromatiales bacterium]|nr:adenosylcobinamide-GDP ribazoletransferase [Gammaproteobacteria bacterium]MBW6475456.1 adenosylcobinamide-GDP ribazoletransferase [Chromatiales bacterium]